jgi:hypothetical protein
VTAVPYVTTLSRVVVNPATGLPLVVNGQQVPLLGPDGPLPPGTLVTLAAGTLLAQGHGIPTVAGGRGTALPDEVILDAGEVSFLRDRVNANNAAIAEICQAASIPVVDVNRFYRDILSGGYVVGGVVLRGSFLTGGLISLDGVHPTDLGYAILANEWIRVINQSGGDLEPVDLGPFTGMVGKVGDLDASRRSMRRRTSSGIRGRLDSRHSRARASRSRRSSPQGEHSRRWASMAAQSPSSSAPSAWSDRRR